jgi:hypothetical protein
MIQAENSDMKTSLIRFERMQGLLIGYVHKKKTCIHFTKCNCKKKEPLKVKTSWHGKTKFIPAGIHKQYVSYLPDCGPFFY